MAHVNWHFWRHKDRSNWSILPQDIHWMGFESSYVIRQGYEPFGVSSVPNALDQNQIRVWTRRQGTKDHFKQYEIKVQSASWGGHQVLLHLSSGWEPFAVSDTGEAHIIWFRKDADE